MVSLDTMMSESSSRKFPTMFPTVGSLYISTAIRRTCVHLNLANYLAVTLCSAEDKGNESKWAEREAGVSINGQLLYRIGLPLKSIQKLQLVKHWAIQVGYLVHARLLLWGGCIWLRDHFLPVAFTLVLQGRYAESCQPRKFGWWGPDDMSFLPCLSEINYWPWGCDYVPRSGIKGYISWLCWHQQIKSWLIFIFNSFFVCVLF